MRKDERESARRMAVNHTRAMGREEECVGIIGLGLIGGSIAHDLSASGVRVLGFDSNVRMLEAAIAAGVVHASLGAAFERVVEVDTLLIAVPVDAALQLLDAVARIDAGCLVMDVGSTKQSIVAAANETPLRARFVGAHPMAGDHRAGFDAARSGMFGGATVYLCPAAVVGPAMRARAEDLWRRLGARTHSIDAAAHDALLAWTSHLPQAVSTSLARALTAAGITSGQLGQGGRDMTRIAASDPDVWTPILLDNAPAVTEALDRFAGDLQALLRALGEQDRATVHRLLAEGNALHPPVGGAEPAPAADIP